MFKFEDIVLASDAELLGRHLFGDDDRAFEELVRRHSKMVMNVCRAMLLNRDDVEDAFQATFLVLARKASTLLQRNSIAGWLYHVAVRNCLHSRRINARKGVESMSSEPVSQENEPWLSIAQAQECELIHREIDQLPPRYRDAIVVCHVQGFSRSEAAELLDQSEASIKAALARGRNLLRRRLVRRGIMTTAVLATIRARSLTANADVYESLIQSTVQTCKTSNTVGLADSSSTIQIIAQNGVSMNSFFYSKSILALAGISILCLPLIVLANSDFEFNEPGQLAIEASDANVSKSPAVTIVDETAPETAPMVDDDQKGIQDKEAVEAEEAVVDPGQFEIENSREYWQLMARSHQRKLEQISRQIKGLRRFKMKGESGAATSEGVFGLESLRFETEAKIVEAKLNIKRINFEKQGKTRVDPRMVPPASTADVQPGEVLVVKSVVDDMLDDSRVVVQADRTISLKLIGTVSVKGMTPDEIRIKLNHLYSKFVNSPDIFIRRLSPFDAQRALER